MFDLKNFFKTDNSIGFYKLYNSLRRWQDLGIYPSENELPDQISFPDDFWKKVIKLYKGTRADEFERAISVFWADGDLILSRESKGNRVSITPRSTVQVRYSPTTKRDYAQKEVFLDGKSYSKRKIYYKKIPKEIEVKHLFNLHTHPPHYNGNDTSKAYYSFFSAQDIKSLVTSKNVLAGMISDKLWIIFRTNLTPSNVTQLKDSQINMEFLIKELHIACYSGEFKSKLVRHHPSDF